MAKAKEWDVMKQRAVIPTLLCDKLLDYYLDLSEDKKGSMGALKKALASRVGLSAYLLVGAKKCMNCSQGTPESVADYLGDLKKLFKRAYPTENLDSIWTASLHLPAITSEEMLCNLR